MTELEAVVAGAYVDRAVYALRPDYRALLMAVDGIVPGPGDAESERLLLAAEAFVDGLGGQPVDELPHVAAWREAYRSFGAKPQRTRNSLEALTRRAAGGGQLRRTSPELQVARRVIRPDES
jgi:DNA/RNA-binding domain of Phe-tRNA-synthetase-like protein